MEQTSASSSSSSPALSSDQPKSDQWPATMTFECTLFDVASYTIFGGTICCFGVIGNFLSYLVLNRTKDSRFTKDHKTIVTSFLLSALAVADALLSMVAIPLYVLQPLSFYQAAHNSFVRYLWPMYQMPYTGAVLLTVLVSFNRYMAACRPFSGTGSNLEASRRHVTGVVIFSIVYNIPRFFEYQKESHFNVKLNQTEEMFSLSPLGSNTLYRVLYCNLLYFLLIHGGPLISLSFLNYKLIIALQERHKRKDKLRGRSSVAVKIGQASLAVCDAGNRNGVKKRLHQNMINNYNDDDDGDDNDADIKIVKKIEVEVEEKIRMESKKKAHHSPSNIEPHDHRHHHHHSKFLIFRKTSQKSIKSLPPSHGEMSISSSVKHISRGEWLSCPLPNNQKALRDILTFPLPPSSSSSSSSAYELFFDKLLQTRPLHACLENLQTTFLSAGGHLYGDSATSPKNIQHHGLMPRHGKQGNNQQYKQQQYEDQFPLSETTFQKRVVEFIISNEENSEELKSSKKGGNQVLVAKGKNTGNNKERNKGRYKTSIEQEVCLECEINPLDSNKITEGMNRVKETTSNILEKKNQQKHPDRQQHQHKQDLTLVLIVVVFTFIFCHTPAFVDTILWTILDGSQKRCGRWLFYYTAIADILVMFNSSANFAIYVLTSPRFRSDLLSYLSIGLFKQKSTFPDVANHRT